MSNALPDRRQRRFQLGIVVIGLAAMLLGGCAAAYRRLPGERHLDGLSQLLDKTAAAGMQTRFVTIDVGNGRTARLALHVCGDHSAGGMIVLIPGVASSGRMWRYQVGELVEQGWRVVVVDPIGCGDSDAPDPRSLGPDAYSPLWLSRSILQALRRELERAPPEQTITLVGHSLGGMVILRMLSDPQLQSDHADVLERVDGAVLFTPIDVAVEKDQPFFARLRRLKGWHIALASTSGMLRSRVAAAINQSVVDPRLGTREEADRVLWVLRDERRRRAMQAMIARAIPHQAGQPDWEEIERLVSCYADIWQPCLIVWGGRDELFSASIGEKLANRIPGARLRIIVAGKHCLPTEHPRVSLDLIHDFTERADGAIGSDMLAELRTPQPAAPVLRLADLQYFPIAPGTAPASGNLGSLLARVPHHTRTSCSDESPSNGSLGKDGRGPDCTRCFLLLVKQGSQLIMSRATGQW